MLGQAAEAAADAEQAAALGTDYVEDTSRIEAYQALQMRRAGDYQGAIRVLERIAQRLNVTTLNKGRAFLLYTRIINNLRSVGRDRQGGSLRQQDAGAARRVALMAAHAQYGSSWAAFAEEGTLRIAVAKGRHRDAEVSARKAQSLFRDALAKSKTWDRPPEQDSFENSIDSALVDEGRAKMRQGRLVEAEIDMRRALLARLKAVGKYHFSTGNMLFALGWVLNEQGRFSECETLVRASLEVFDVIGLDQSSTTYVRALSNLGGALFAQRKYEENLRVVAADGYSHGVLARQAKGEQQDRPRPHLQQLLCRQCRSGHRVRKNRLQHSQDSQGEQHLRCRPRSRRAGRGPELCQARCGSDAGVQGSPARAPGRRWSLRRGGRHADPQR